MADKHGFRRIAEWIQSDDEIKAVVVSAGGKSSVSVKVTDLLLSASEQIFNGERIFKALTPFIERVLADAESIGLENLIKDELMRIEQEVEKDLSLDFILSRGEYFYSKLFSFYYGIPFVDSSKLIGFYADGSLNMGLSEYQISKSYEKYGRFVCGGFYGGLPNGKIKTFTRGGSDFSGAIVTRAIKASQYLNFTDVDGVFPFDPKIKESKPIDEISFDKIRILGEFGTTVLHPASVLPLYGTQSQIQVKNTFNKHAKGTLITQNCIKTPYAVAKKQNCSYVKIINRGKGYSTCNFMASIKKKVYCCLYALDFVEFCIEGTFSDELLREQNIDFCQIQDNVTVCYLTSSKETEKAIERIQELKLAVMINVFDYGAYIVFKEENKQEVLGIIYDN